MQVLKKEKGVSEMCTILKGVLSFLDQRYEFIYWSYE